MQNALSPVEYDMVQGVFKSLARADWFDRNDANERECAKLVLIIHSAGIGDADTLLRTCEPQARKRFTKTSAA